MTAAFICSTTSHEALKRDRDAWRALPFVGIQLCGEDFDDALELRNCNAPGCCSTLCRSIGVEMSPLRRIAADVYWRRLGDAALLVLAAGVERAGREWRMGGAP